MALVMLRYGHDSKIKNHATLAGSSVCEDDIRERYGVSPVEREPIDEYFLDPGGFAFSNTEPIRFEAGGVDVAIKPEHLYAIDGLGTRTFTDWKTTSSWTKIYAKYSILVVPTAVWGELLSIARAFEKITPSGQEELAERLQHNPHAGVQFRIKEE